MVGLRCAYGPLDGWCKGVCKGLNGEGPYRAILSQYVALRIRDRVAYGAVYLNA